MNNITVSQVSVWGNGLALRLTKPMAKAAGVSEGTPVRVTVVFPGAVATSITENSGVHAPAVAGANENAANRKVLPPSEAAAIIINGMEKGSYRVLVGRDAQVMDLLTRLVPERAMIMIADQMAGLLQRSALPQAQSPVS